MFRKRAQEIKCYTDGQNNEDPITSINLFSGAGSETVGGMIESHI